jgi:hypothetical protein
VHVILHAATAGGEAAKTEASVLQKIDINNKMVNLPLLIIWLLYQNQAIKSMILKLQDRYFRLGELQRPIK